MHIYIIDAGKGIELQLNHYSSCQKKQSTLQFVLFAAKLFQLSTIFARTAPLADKSLVLQSLSPGQPDTKEVQQILEKKNESK